MIGLIALGSAMTLGAADGHAQEAPKTRVVVVTGGHDFQREPFFAMFDSFQGLEYREAAHPDANTEYVPDKAASYDVLVFYDMNQQITDEQKAQLVALLNAGKGVVALHHTLGSYSAWPEWEKIIGGRYLFAAREQDGATLGPSTYRHDVDIPVDVADPDHPVTAGVSDFTIHDEVYGSFWVDPTVHPLLTTDHPESSPTIGWCHTYGASRVVCIQLGHDQGAYANESYRKLVRQAIAWVAEGE